MTRDEEIDALIEYNRSLSKIRKYILINLDMDRTSPWAVALGRSSMLIRDEIYRKMTEDHA